MFCPFQHSGDRVEMQFMTNHLGHFYLTNRLLHKMKETAKSTGIQDRVMNLSSVAHGCPYFTRSITRAGLDIEVERIAGLVRGAHAGRCIRAIDGIFHGFVLESNLREKSVIFFVRAEFRVLRAGSKPTRLVIGINAMANALRRVRVGSLKFALGAGEKYSSMRWATRVDSDGGGEERRKIGDDYVVEENSGGSRRCGTDCGDDGGGRGGGSDDDSGNNDKKSVKKINGDVGGGVVVAAATAIEEVWRGVDSDGGGGEKRKIGDGYLVGENDDGFERGGNGGGDDGGGRGSGSGDGDGRGNNDKKIVKGIDG
ncbi:Short-chain dehydrogenase TIC 32, chloroplastic [Capsicum baccatum]|uniref:Short-chain dehydrogenase TIC 32, chloroplastic n=1 Tax=Capsicum baccatum TaxID=33114 RepID=A0A2G2VXM1_CAPBA|nr:Short-chain dehydrogenase TIC 32, chloroplastic [Capsicum baccatum]